MSQENISKEIEKLTFLKSQSQRLSDETWGLNQTYLDILDQLEMFIDDLKQVSMKISKQIADNFLSLDEASSLKEELEITGKSIQKFMSHHDYNKGYLNNLIELNSIAEKLLQKLPYVENVEYHKFGEYMTKETQEFFLINSTAKYQLYSKIQEMIHDGVDSDHPSRGIVEQSLIEFLQFLANCDGLLVDDVIYGRQTAAISALHSLRNRFKQHLHIFVQFYKESMFINLIREAIEGVDKILEHKEMKSAQEVKLQGFISNVDGFGQINYLNKRIKRL